MCFITFDLLDEYDYISPEPVQVYTKEEVLKLTGRPLERYKADQKMVGKKMDTMNCEFAALFMCLFWLVCLSFCLFVCLSVCTYRSSISLLSLLRIVVSYVRGS